MTASFEGQKLQRKDISIITAPGAIPECFKEKLKYVYVLQPRTRKASVRLQCNSVLECTFQTGMLVQLAGYRGHGFERHSFVEACFHQP